MKPKTSPQSPLEVRQRRQHYYLLHCRWTSSSALVANGPSAVSYHLSVHSFVQVIEATDSSHGQLAVFVGVDCTHLPLRVLGMALRPQSLDTDLSMVVSWLLQQVMKMGRPPKPPSNHRLGPEPPPTWRIPCRRSPTSAKRCTRWSKVSRSRNAPASPMRKLAAAIKSLIVVAES